VLVTNLEWIREQALHKQEHGVKAMALQQRVLLHELNLPRDPDARLGNWYLTDIEKILQEAKVLNACYTEEHQCLPSDEIQHNVAQNPKVGSSIGPTQHTQIALGGMARFKVYSFEEKPQPCEQLCGEGGSIDVVQVGHAHADASMVRLMVADPTNKSLLETLCALRMAILRAHGGVLKVRDSLSIDAAHPPVDEN
jgi:hypothetical protein